MTSGYSHDDTKVCVDIPTHRMPYFLDMCIVCSVDPERLYTHVNAPAEGPLSMHVCDMVVHG